MEMTLWWLTYPLLGIFGGFVAGLFGVGGGLTLVPFMFMLFSAQHFAPEQVMHLALGTSMATIVFTSVSSMRAHHRHGAVNWHIVRSLAPGLVLGTFGGSLVAGLVPTRPMTVIFVVIVYYAALQMIMDFKPKPHRQLPGPVGLFLTGGVIGIVSSLVAAGGGFLSIPFMVFCNVAIHGAVGTSAALGFPIALAGAIGYIVSGWNDSGLPPYTLGYVYLPAFFGIVTMSMLVAPFGAKLAHRLPVKKLKRAFGVFLALLATKMLFSLLG
ncbi:MAG TPA: sulfite exporter TauE/SafE family protein [Rhodocyclaceae bacterium]|nr:sulfite exporter TauE/SafE family protein [Rhodocyclaceae bacterium]